jgi:hypothetical protein
MARTKLEREFEAEFMETINEIFPNGWWIKGNSVMQQGIPDRTFFWGPHWAMFEFKRATGAAQQANQDWFIEYFNNMSFAAFVTPQNCHEVLDEIQQAFRR